MYLKDFPAEQATNKNAKNANHLLIKCTSRQDSRCVNDKTPAKATSQRVRTQTRVGRIPLPGSLAETEPGHGHSC